jgi:hypothetical protein
MQTGMAPKRWALWKAPNEPKQENLNTGSQLLGIFLTDSSCIAATCLSLTGLSLAVINWASRLKGGKLAMRHFYLFRAAAPLVVAMLALSD